MENLRDTYLRKKREEKGRSGDAGRKKKMEVQTSDRLFGANYKHC